METIKVIDCIIEYCEFTKPVTDNSMVMCPWCGIYSKASSYEFRMDLCGCETCGSHDGFVCPACTESIDPIFTYKLNVM